VGGRLAKPHQQCDDHCSETCPQGAVGWVNNRR